MCTPEAAAFVRRALTVEDVKGRRVVEVGSCDVNGSARSALEVFGPARYVGVDIVRGPSVDVVEDASRLVGRFGPASFDVVLSTEMVEHVEDWRAVFTNLKGLCALGGVVVVTTRSPGFPYHACPDDFWRYTPADMGLIFADFEVEMLESERDPAKPGVFIKARKADARPVVDLGPIALHSVFTGGREVAFTARFRRSLFARREGLVQRVGRCLPERVKAPLRGGLGR